MRTLISTSFLLLSNMQDSRAGGGREGGGGYVIVSRRESGRVVMEYEGECCGKIIAGHPECPHVHPGGSKSGGGPLRPLQASTLQRGSAASHPVQVRGPLLPSCSPSQNLRGRLTLTAPFPRRSQEAKDSVAITYRQYGAHSRGMPSLRLEAWYVAKHKFSSIHAIHVRKTMDLHCKPSAFSLVARKR